MSLLDPAAATQYLHLFSSALFHPRSTSPAVPGIPNKPNSKPRKLTPKPTPLDATSSIDFPVLSSLSKPAPSSPPKPKQPTLHRTTSENSPLPVSPYFHLQCIGLCPHLLVPALHALVTASRLPQSYALPNAVAGHSTHESLTNHASTVLGQLSGLLQFFPHPLRQALPSLSPLSDFPVGVSTFPVPTGPQWIPPIAPVISNDDSAPPLSKRLISNLEITYDAILTLQRRFRGDFSPHPAGTFDAFFASRSLSSLHPANMDAFAARFIQLVSAASLTFIDDKVFRLDARMRAGEGKANDIVVLHRLPTLVRSMFKNPSHAFFLEFLTGVDSARLNAALVPRLSSALVNALRTAASATSNKAFSDAVIDARLFAKLLCVTLNTGNWAHSEYAMTGGGQGQGLSAAALELRVLGHQAAWTTNFDVEKVVKSAVESRGAHAVVASVAVADVVIKLCAVDPVARKTEWYSRTLRVLNSVRVRPKGGDMFPLLDSMIAELVDEELCREGIAKLEAWERGTDVTELTEDAEACAGIGDAQLLQECCVTLEALRRAVSAPSTNQTNVRNEQRATRRIQPVVAKAVDTSGSEERMEDMLKEEFLKRMDGRLRELIGVVACSRVGDKDRAEKAYVQVASMLYPDAAETAVRVAATLCAERVARIGSQGGGEVVDGTQVIVEDQLRIENKGHTKIGGLSGAQVKGSTRELARIMKRTDDGCNARDKKLTNLEKRLERTQVSDHVRH